MPVCDVPIKNAHIINGSGIEPWVGDVAIDDGVFLRSWTGSRVHSAVAGVDYGDRRQLRHQRCSRDNPEYFSFTAKRRSAA